MLKCKVIFNFLSVKKKNTFAHITHYTLFRFYQVLWRWPVCYTFPHIKLNGTLTQHIRNKLCFILNIHILESVLQDCSRYQAQLIWLGQLLSPFHGRSRQPDGGWTLTWPTYAALRRKVLYEYEPFEDNNVPRHPASLLVAYTYVNMLICVIFLEKGWFLLSLKENANICLLNDPVKKNLQNYSRCMVCKHADKCMDAF